MSFHSLADLDPMLFRKVKNKLGMKHNLPKLPNQESSTFKPNPKAKSEQIC